MCGTQASLSRALLPPGPGAAGPGQALTGPTGSLPGQPARHLPCTCPVAPLNVLQGRPHMLYRLWSLPPALPSLQPSPSGISPRSPLTPAPKSHKMKLHTPASVACPRRLCVAEGSRGPVCLSFLNLLPAQCPAADTASVRPMGAQRHGPQYPTAESGPGPRTQSAWPFSAGAAQEPYGQCSSSAAKPEKAPGVKNEPLYKPCTCWSVFVLFGE